MSADRTNPVLWEKIKRMVIGEEVQGTRKGQWSARKAQLAVKLYKQRGGSYRGKKSSKNSLQKWQKQHWRTKSGLSSHVTGERYLPAEAIRRLSSRDYKRTSTAKRISMKQGRQFSRQPSDIAKKTKYYRR